MRLILETWRYIDAISIDGMVSTTAWISTAIILNEIYWIDYRIKHSISPQRMGILAINIPLVVMTDVKSEIGYFINVNSRLDSAVIIYTFFVKP